MEEEVFRPTEETVEMKIEANPTPEQIKWLILVALIAAGLGHEQILGLLP